MNGTKVNILKYKIAEMPAETITANEMYIRLGRQINLPIMLPMKQLQTFSIKDFLLDHTIMGHGLWLFIHSFIGWDASRIP